MSAAHTADVSNPVTACLGGSGLSVPWHRMATASCSMLASVSSRVTRKRKFSTLSLRSAVENSSYSRYGFIAWEFSCRSHCGVNRPSPTSVVQNFRQCRLRGAWRDRDTNDIFAHCFLIFYFLDFKLSKFVCPSELHRLIRFVFKNFFRKGKISEKPSKTP